MLQKYELLLNLVATKKLKQGHFFPHSIFILHYIVNHSTIAMTAVMLYCGINETQLDPLFF